MRSTLKPEICFLKPPGPSRMFSAGNAAVVEMQLAPFLAAHEGRRRADAEAGRVALDQHRADAAEPRAEPDIDEEDLRVRAEGREQLGAVEHVVRAVGPGAGREIGHGGAGLRLAHAEAHDGAAGQQVGQPLLLLRRARVFGEGADRAEIAELQHVGAARADGGDLLDRDHGVHQGAALPAVLGRDRDAHQALPAHQLRHLERKARIVGAGERVLGEMRLREAAHRLGKEFLLLGEVEVHRLSPLNQP